MRTIKNDVNPIMNPRNPTHAVTFCINGLSSMSEIFPPSLLRKAVKVKSKKNMIENDTEMAMKTGVVDVGAERRFGAFFGRTERLYVGFKLGEVQINGAWLFDRENEPRTPKRTVGPSTVPVLLVVKTRDGLTASSDTCECSMTTGDR